jgi:hypothetical protein
MDLLRRSVPLLAAVAAVLSPTAAKPAAGQACGSGSGRYVVRVQPGLLAFPVPTPEDFATGWIEHGPVELSVRPRGAANRPWVVCLRADSPDMGGGKPISDLQFKKADQGTWASISLGDQPLAEGNRGDRITLSFRILLDEATDAAGSYRADYTVTAARP